MDIREWFNLKNGNENEFEKYIEELLNLYKRALFKYFSITDSFYNITEFLRYIGDKMLSTDQELFFQWFNRIGLPTIQNVFNETISFDIDLIAEFEYEIYYMSESINSDADDIRSMLINVVVDLPDRISRVTKVK
jgi:hypothetical protein